MRGRKLRLTLVAVVILSLFLRLFNLNSLFHFTMDEELVAFRALGLFSYHRPFLIGGISPLQIHLPPYFYYLASLLLWPFKFNPAGWGVSGALLGGITTVVLFGFARRLTNARTALIAAALYATSQAAVFADRHFWPLSLNPLLTLLSLIFLKSKNYWALIATLVLAITADPSNLPLALVMAGVAIWRNYAKWKQIGKPFLTGALVFLTPLILFDLRHQGENVKGIVKLFSRVAGQGLSLNGLADGLLLLPKTLTRFWWTGQTKVVEMLSYCYPNAQFRQQVPLVLLMLSIAILILVWRKLPPVLHYLFIAYAAGLGLFGFLGYPVFDHYLTGWLPLFALITALALDYLPKTLGAGLAIGLIAVNLFLVFQTTNPYGLSYKQELVVWANRELNGQPFSLESESKCHKENGLRYLFEISGNPPATSFMDGNFAWLYQNPPRVETPQLYLLVTDKDFSVFQPIISSRQFGAMKALITAEPVVPAD